VAAAAVVQAASRAATMDGGPVILIAVRLIWETKMHGGTAEAARAAALSYPTKSYNNPVLSVSCQTENAPSAGRYSPRVVALTRLAPWTARSSGAVT
jgi:hypothetical protein